MKKIMFNDRFLLTEAVLQRRKTQTRRIITHPQIFKGKIVRGFYVCKNYKDEVTEICMYDEDESPIDGGQILPYYKVGETVAVAQRYSVVFDEYLADNDHPELYEGISQRYVGGSKGWCNKMFIKPDLMPHQVLITDVRVQRLQEITDEECMLEGIQKYDIIGDIQRYITSDGGLVSDDVKHCYSWMIDKISGKGTWDKNPFVFAYSFKLER